MSLESNIGLLVSTGLEDFPGTVSRRVSGFARACVRREVPEGWREELCGLASGPAATAQLVPVEFENPCASYAEACVPLPGGGEARGRLIVPEGPLRPRGRVPLVLMFHDAGRPVRGWHHMTRFAALGQAVLALDGGTVPVDGAADALPGLAAQAVALARAGLELPFVDRGRVSTWGEGLGGTLAVLVAASMGERVARCAAQGALLADDPRVPAWLDAAVAARLVSAELLVGAGLRDELASPESQAALARAAGGPSRLVIYPEHGHERINEFENEVLRFLRFD